MNHKPHFPLGDLPCQKSVLLFVLLMALRCVDLLAQQTGTVIDIYQIVKIGNK
jgi:hypothetical protein